jgi:hypothetical protein
MTKPHSASEGPQQTAPPAGKSRLRLFLGRHDSVVIFIGAFIVFATFIFREEVREELKDLVGSIDSAQTVFATRRDVSAIGEQLNTVGTIASDIASTVLGGRTEIDRQQNSVLALRFRVFATRDYAGTLAASVDNISHLLEKLDPKTAQNTRLTQLRAKTTNLRNRCEEEMNHLEPWAIDAKHPKTALEMSRLNQELMPLIIDSVDVSQDIQKLAEDVLKRAEEAKKKQERRYRIVNWLSVGFFTAGWGLGLIAKLCGVDGVSAES